jgi:glycosyltransferase involved in cell wall biosynthesis
MDDHKQFSDGQILTIVVMTQQLGNVISGIGLYARNLVEYLINDGHRVIVIAPEDQMPQGELAYTFISVPSPIAGDSQARWISLSLSFARELNKLRLQGAFDIVHFTDGREALFCKSHAPMVGNINDTYAASIKPLAFYQRYFNDWLLRWGYYRLVHLLEPVALKHLKKIVANSQYTANVIKEAYSIPEKQLSVCHKSISNARYEIIQDLRKKEPNHAARVLFVGGNMQRKGLPNLIEAAPAVLDQYPETEFWIAGRDKAEATMRSLCDQAGISQHFHFLGWQSQEDLLKIYSQADIFVMPSLIEAFGVVFLEAMAAGLPVIGTRVGGIPEIIEDGRNGLLVEAGDVPAMGKAIISIMGDQGLRERLRQAGIMTAQSFDIKNMMECTYRIYADVLRDH